MKTQVFVGMAGRDDRNQATFLNSRLIVLYGLPCLHPVKHPLLASPACWSLNWSPDCDLIGAKLPVNRRTEGIVPFPKLRLIGLSIGVADFCAAGFFVSIAPIPAANASRSLARSCRLHRLGRFRFGNPPRQYRVSRTCRTCAAGLAPLAPTAAPVIYSDSPYSSLPSRFVDLLLDHTITPQPPL